MPRSTARSAVTVEDQAERPSPPAAPPRATSPQARPRAARAVPGDRKVPGGRGAGRDPGPVEEPAGARDDRREPAGVAPPRPLGLLVVGGDADGRAGLVALLGSDGHRVEVAATLRAALAGCRGRAFDAILLDHRLPDGTVESALGQFRLRAEGMPSIVLADPAELGDAFAALRLGAYDYLLKPVHPDALRACLGRLAVLRGADPRPGHAQRLADLGRMTTTLAHEGRNALNRVKLGLAAVDRTPKESPLSREGLDCIRSGCDDLEYLFLSLRSYASPLALDPRRHDLMAVVRDAWADLADCRTGREARLRIEPEAAALPCEVDGFRMKQVFRNLLENALAACPDPVEIAVTTAPARAGGPPAVEVRLRDNGPGVAAALRDRLFEPFVTTKPGGTGLGLALVRQIVEAHGGRIVAEAGDCPGAAFLLTALQGRDLRDERCEPPGGGRGRLSGSFGFDPDSSNKGQPAPAWPRAAGCPV